MARTALEVLGEDAKSVALRAKDAGVPMVYGLFGEDEAECLGIYGAPLECLTVSIRLLGRVLARTGYDDAVMKAVLGSVVDSADEFRKELAEA